MKIGAAAESNGRKMIGQLQVILGAAKRGVAIERVLYIVFVTHRRYFNGCRGEVLRCVDSGNILLQIFFSLLTYFLLYYLFL